MLLTLNSVIVIGSNQPGIHALWNNKINIEIGGKSIEKAAPTHVLKFFFEFFRAKVVKVRLLHWAYSFLWRLPFQNGVKVK